MVGGWSEPEQVHGAREAAGLQSTSVARRQPVALTKRRFRPLESLARAPRPVSDNMFGTLKGAWQQ